MANKTNLNERTSQEDLDAIRTKAKEILTSLDYGMEWIDSSLISANTTTSCSAPAGGGGEEAKQEKLQTYHSWIRGKINLHERLHSSIETNQQKQNQKQQYPSKQCQYFDKHGFLLVKSFCDQDEIQVMKDEMHHLVTEQWNPNPNQNDDRDYGDGDGDGDSNGSGNNKNKITIFRTDEDQIDNQGSDDYFLTSANKVHFFAEHKAMDENGQLQPQYYNHRQNKILALNKVGHGLHLLPQSSYKSYTTSSKIQQLVLDLGWINPVVPQSMYIFKQALVGDQVTSHQDSTFLYTTPKQSCLGLWLALDDATIQNGCLWVRPYSHKETVRRKFERNVEHFGLDAIQNRSNKALGDTSKSQMIFTHESGCIPIPWDGGIPPFTSADTSKNDTIEKPVWDHLFDAGFIPIECKAGDLVVFPGELDHLSLPNFSNIQRHTFQLHLVEGPGSAGVTWSETNWLQYPNGEEFLNLIE